LDSLFREKLLTSGLREYIELSAEVEGEEKKIIERYALD
jgi:metal-dependent HD superfamily phosphatase/phosphodiesterase